MQGLVDAHMQYRSVGEVASRTTDDTPERRGTKSANPSTPLVRHCPKRDEMTQNTARFDRPRHSEDPDATAYIDPMRAAEAYHVHPEYRSDRDAWAIDEISKRGVTDFVQWVNLLPTVNGAYQLSDDHAIAVEDIFSGARVLL